MRIVTTALLAALLGSSAAGQSGTTAFAGNPAVKVSEGGVERLVEDLPRDRAVNLACVISRIGDSYYWASRENVELLRVDAGAFVTFIALNGSGYVRVTLPEARTAAAAMGPTEGRFDYVEHLLIGLRSVTYYGHRR